MTKEELAAIKRIIRKDKKFQRMKELYETNPAYSIDFEGFHKEISTIHLTRNTRSLRRKKSNQFVENVIDAMLQDAAGRSRIVEILGQCVKIGTSMEKTVSNVRDYLLSEYTVVLRKLGTQTERKYFVESVMRAFYEYLSQIETLEKHARLVVDDIDKAGYVYKNLIESIKILTRPEQTHL